MSLTPAPESGSGIAEEAVEDLAGGEPGEAGVDQHNMLALVDAGAEADARSDSFWRTMTSCTCRSMSWYCWAVTSKIW
jgi:hypothetical protein